MDYAPVTQIRTKPFNNEHEKKKKLKRTQKLIV